MLYETPQQRRFISWIRTAPMAMILFDQVEEKCSTSRSQEMFIAGMMSQSRKLVDQFHLSAVANENFA